MLEIQKIDKFYGDVEAVSQLSFSARDGEITALLGTNGSGKSTTLKAIAGLIEPTSGFVNVDEIRVSSDPLSARKRLGFFPDQFGLYPRLTSREHIAYFGRFHGLRGAALDEAINTASELLGMSDILDRRTEGFSQGQRMKVALARTLVHNPRNLILDEPMRGLDITSIRMLRGLMQTLQSDGRTILFSSHVLSEVDLLSDRVVLIDKGKLVADASPQELKKQAGCSSLENAFLILTNQT